MLSWRRLDRRDGPFNLNDIYLDIYMKVVFDAGPLITACKFEVEGKLVIDHLLTDCRVLIPPSVEEEVAILGARYPDGVAAGERIADSRIRVVRVDARRWGRLMHGYALGDGERDSIELCGQEPNVQAFVTDDHLAFVAATRLGLAGWMLPDPFALLRTSLVVELMSRRLLTSRLVRSILEGIRPRYRAGGIEYSLEKLREVEKDAESGGSD